MKVQQVVPILEAFQMTKEAANIDPAHWPNWLYQAWQKRESHIGSLAAGPEPDNRLVFVHENGDAVVVPWGDWFLYNPNAPNVRALSRVPNPYFCEHYEEVHDGHISFREALNLLMNRYELERKTPDWVLSRFVAACLAAYEAAINAKEAVKA